MQDDYNDLKRELAENPEKGTVLTGTGGVRKIRLKSASRGKSGGFRVCYFYYVFRQTIYLIQVFQKNEQENLRDRSKITFSVLEGKIDLSIENFSLQRETRLSAAEKFSKSKPFFSSTTLNFILERSLSAEEKAVLKKITNAIKGKK